MNRYITGVSKDMHSFYIMVAVFLAPSRTSTNESVCEHFHITFTQYSAQTPYLFSTKPVSRAYQCYPTNTFAIDLCGEIVHAQIFGEN